VYDNTCTPSFLPFPWVYVNVTENGELRVSLDPFLFSVAVAYLFLPSVIYAADFLQLSTTALPLPPFFLFYCSLLPHKGPTLAHGFLFRCEYQASLNPHGCTERRGDNMKSYSSKTVRRISLTRIKQRGKKSLRERRVYDLFKLPLFTYFFCFYYCTRR
jgi:hypothetical protein